MTVADRIAALDETLFDAIETQTTPADRRSLLALHQLLGRSASPTSRSARIWAARCRC